MPRRGSSPLTLDVVELPPFAAASCQAGIDLSWSLICEIPSMLTSFSFSLLRMSFMDGMEVAGGMLRAETLPFLDSDGAELLSFGGVCSCETVFTPVDRMSNLMSWICFSIDDSSAFKVAFCPSRVLSSVVLMFSISSFRYLSVSSLFRFFSLVLLMISSISCSVSSILLDLAFCSSKNSFWSASNFSSRLSTLWNSWSIDALSCSSRVLEGGRTLGTTYRLIIWYMAYETPAVAVAMIK
ncbi:hypothetical protein OGAPHI_003863 [Ogataea philodendri]|uniref:Uncharacterized protein n=1 Tax=Ogataea philodendri TaxID=1378263 RepID=A0A9P8T534_9ASCO|nr:uncharacterized protein OGAPHI_003863 [Ogataea philodendri]KAH3665675.1 hypothetical protein OGAPHI_003863 [Ogataea philodendri]